LDGAVAVRGRGVHWVSFILARSSGGN
jgi:hypothetical protein